MQWLKRSRPVEAPVRRRPSHTNRLGDLFERLEERIAFYVVPMLQPFPHHGTLDHIMNTVVRINTNMGNIDIELFDQTAPANVANFRNYIDQGRLDETFFHSKTASLLIGGNYKFFNTTGAAPVSKFPSVVNEFSRMNLEGTVGMWKDTTNPNSATSQFYINIQDNPGLNIQNGGYTVIGKVVRGWNVVQAIAGLQVRDLNQALIGAPPGSGTFDNVPTRNNYFPSIGPTEASLVRIQDIEVIKTWGSARYYNHASYISEGFRGAQVVESIHLQNVDRDIFNFYQVIVRYETGERDQVITRGFLQAGERITFKIADFNFPNYNIVRPNTPYAIEVRSTRPMAASLNHRDFGVTLEESFLPVLGLRQNELQRWALPSGEKGPDLRSFVTWQNLTPGPVTLTVHIRFENGTNVSLQRTVEAYKRGGLNIHTMGTVPAGRFAVQINANNPIVAGLSHYKLGANANTANGSNVMGAPNGGSTSGILAGAQVPVGGEAYINLIYTSTTPNLVLVDIEYILSNGTVLQSPVVTLTAAQRSARVDILAANPAVPTNTFFSIRYSVRLAAGNVAAQYISRHNGDEKAATFQTFASRTIAFADGYTDPILHESGGMRETISVFNPYRDAGILYSYQLIFQFSDGTLVWSSVQFLNANSRRDHVAYQIEGVRNKVDSGPQFHFYSVQIVSAQFAIPPVHGAAVATLTRNHNTWGQNMAALPAYHNAMSIIWLNDPEFDA